MLSLSKRQNAVLYVSLFLVLVGSRAAVINYGGNSVPFGDEWDAVAAGLLRPYLQGNLKLAELFSAHNEHVIFFTRLMTLLIFKISGYWDVILQMIANAILDALTVVAISAALSRTLPGGWAQIAVILSVLINAIPLGWENMVLGFNTHFYLLLAFSFAGLWLLADSRAWSLRWLAGGLCSAASFLCMASGALTLGAAIGLHLAQIACNRRGGLREWLGIAALGAVTLVLARVVLHAAGSGGLGAHSPAEFAAAFFHFASWPPPFPLGLVIAAPSLIFCIITLVDRPALTDPRWFNVGAYGWTLTQFLALAAGRAEIGVQSRYSDTLLIGLIINLTSAFWLSASATRAAKGRIWPYLGLAAWLVVVGASLAHAVRHVPGDLDNWRRITATGAKNVRDYLGDGNISDLGGAPLLEIPYFESNRLRELLDEPEIRSALPPELLSRDPPRTWVEAFKRTFLRQSFTLLGSGLLLLIALFAWRSRTTARMAHSAAFADGSGKPAQFPRPARLLFGSEPRATMLRRHRRWFAALAAVLLALPPVVGLIAPDNPITVLKEGRRLAPAPRMPLKFAEWIGLTPKVDAYLRDHFGLRHAMIQLHKDLTKPMLGLGGAGPDVLVGRDGRMFYLGGDSVRQSAGLILREQQVADSAAALARMGEALKRQGIGFLVAIPPSSSTMYQESLPIWAQSHGRTTEYDLFQKDLAAYRVKTVDLRPVLKAAASGGKVYLMHDAHWTPRGAIAGFNAVVEADSHPDWRVDPATALGPPTEWKGGDLARMLGVQDDVTEMVEPLAIPLMGKDENLSQEGVMPPHLITTGRSGPTILVVGDSFTFHYFPLLLAPHVARVIWVHYDFTGCGFDQSLIDRFHPDEVWWVRVERVLICETSPQLASQSQSR